MTKSNKVYVGVDVSKKKWDVAFSNSNKVHQLSADSNGEKELLDLLRTIDVQIVCLEATGNYEYSLVKLLQKSNIPYIVVNPRLPRDFAKSMNLLAKTDSIDAKVLAKFAETHQLEPRPQTPENIEKIEALVVRRRQLVEQRVQEMNRKDTLHDADMLKDIEDHISFLSERIARIEKQMDALIGVDPELQETAKILKSVPGIGPATIRCLIGELRELGTLSGKEIARLVGLAPINRDSGQFRGKRMIGGGRVSVRNSIYMPTLVAVKHNPKLREFYERLVQVGKPKMVALAACMRKLIVILNAMIRNKTTWESTKM